MYISQPIFLFLIQTIIMLAITLAVIVSAYIILLIKLKKIQRDRIRLDKQIREHATLLLNHAQKQAISIINNAHQKSKDILNSTKDFTQTSKEQLTRELDLAEKKQEEIISNSAKQFSQMYQQFIDGLEKDFEKDALAEIDEFKSSLLHEASSSKSIIEQKIQQATAEAEKEIQAYKTEKIQNIDRKFLETLTSMSKQVLSKTLTPQDHQELIMKSLEQITKEIQKT